jgi:NADH dehydrogenase FAD-containing subunit
MVKDINREGLTIQSQLGTDRLEARTVIWAGGVTVPPLAGTLATRTNAETDKAGNLAVIGRARAVADVFGFRISGLPAWIVWAFIHLAYIVEFQSRLLVFIQWAIQDLTFSRRARLITHSAPTDFNFNEEIAPYAVTQKGGHDKPESLKAS